MKIVVIDSHVLFREGLVSLFENQPDMEVVGEAKSAEIGISLICEQEPDLVLMHIGSPNDEELDAVKKMRKAQQELIVVVLTNHKSDELLFASLRAGATGFLLKYHQPERFIRSGDFLLEQSVDSPVDWLSGSLQHPDRPGGDGSCRPGDGAKFQLWRAFHCKPPEWITL